MGDQQRWFKLWSSAPADDDLQALSVRDRWAWVVLGVYTKVHGTAGRVLVSVSNVALAGEMGVAPSQLLACIQRLPHIDVTPMQNRHGELPVTVEVVWRNWAKYQTDTTQAERQKRARASRSKKREEEKRKEVVLDSKPKGYVLASTEDSNGQPRRHDIDPMSPTFGKELTAENQAFVADLRARLAKRMSP